ncbi:hypothetical protein [Marinibactrum halimedae]|uniref:Uncharacterized protein n=1 Tax=Marinibactrum halimedae TaxID=1444977 RepID=A0AA37WKM6_9GAMM|nr:hypothetical protein [Marinibactrum halimedae]MCD9459063.1 hypothetical protein [Marinibactrum halimedae]GLS24664.1 hypothetical protein GCM10007877_03780 [Marinibactrum halimedae]
MIEGSVSKSGSNGISGVSNVEKNNIRQEDSNIVSPLDASRHYLSVDDEPVQNFLEAFARNNHVYGLVNDLNNKMKSILREMREVESTVRIRNYEHQFKTALEKRDEILEKAEKIKELTLQKAKLTMVSGVVQGAVGLASAGAGFASSSTIKGSAMAGAGAGIAQGMSKIIDSEVMKLDAEVTDLRMLLDATQTELDAIIDLAKKEGELSNAQISFIDSITNTFSSFINDLHGQHSGTIGSMAKAMV